MVNARTSGLFAALLLLAVMAAAGFGCAESWACGGESHSDTPTLTQARVHVPSARDAAAPAVAGWRALVAGARPTPAAGHAYGALGPVADDSTALRI